MEFSVFGRRTHSDADAFFFFRVEDLKATNDLLDTLRARTGLKLDALASLEWDYWFQSRVLDIPVYVLCIGESGVQYRQIKLIDEAVQETKSRYGFRPFLIRVYVPGAEEPRPNMLLQKSGFKDEDFVDFRKGLDDEEALKRLEDLIRSVKRTYRIFNDLAGSVRGNSRMRVSLPVSDEAGKEERRKQSLSLAMRTFLIFFIIGLGVLLVNAGLSLMVFYCGLLVSLVRSHRYGLRTGYFLISPSNTFLGILVSAGLALTTLIATVETSFKAY